MGRSRKQVPRGEDYVKFGEKIKALREEKNLTQEELSQSLDISKTSVTNYENGTRKVPLSIILKFAEYFNVTVDYLLDIKVKDETQSKQQLTKYEVASELGFTDEEISVLQSGVKQIPTSFFEKFANYFNVDVENLNALSLEAERKHAVITTDEVLTQRYKKWQNAIGYNHFTDEEIDQLIDFAKYLISKRK